MQTDRSTRPVAIVTGVSRGLGEALSLSLLEHGYAVTGIGRSSSPRLEGQAYRFVHCDFADVAAISAVLEPAFRAIAATRPSAVCLFNNAASAEPVGVLGSLDDRAIATSLLVNLAAPVAVANVFCRVFADDAVERLLINVSSGAAQHAITGAGTYSIAKAGLEMLTKQLVAEQRASSFRAITLRPGIIDTDMQTFMRTRPDDALPSAAMFKGFHESGQLVPPDTAAATIVSRLLLTAVEQGRTYSYKDL